MFLALLIIFGSLLIIVGIGALILMNSDDLILFVFGTGLSALAISLLNSLYFQNKPVLSKKIQIACEVVFAFAVTNFLAFIVISFLIGGDALHGKMADGHYYLRGLFGDREVPFMIYVFSLTHAKSLFITHPLAILAGWIHFMTGGYGRIKQLPNLLKVFSRKSKQVVYKDELPKSRY